MEKYLSPQRTLFLESDTKEDVLREMVGTLCRHDTDLDDQAALEALFRREKLLSSRIAPSIALPHALLPDYGKPIVAVGYSSDGVPWDSPGGEPVNLVILSLCGRSYSREHVTMMADIANTLRNPGVLERITEAETTREIYDILRAPGVTTRARPKGEVSELCRQVMQHGESLARRTNAGAVMVMADNRLPLGFLSERTGEVPLIVVTNESSPPVPDNVHPDHLLTIPGYGFERIHRVKLALLYALSSDLIDRDDTVVCLSGKSDSESLNVLEVLEVSREFEVLLSFGSKLEAGDINPHVFDRVLELASTLAIEGREGKPVGAIFIIGDYQGVQPRCYQLVINPFRGYPESERNVLDPGLEETIKEFARVDGACLIRGDGIVMSLGTYIQAEDAARALQSGLGARHAAGMAITTSTRAVSIVISESTRRISIFQDGKLVLALDPARRSHG